MRFGTLLCMTLLLTGWATAAEEAAAEAPTPGTAPEKTDAVSAGIVATVNGEPVSFEDLERRLQEAHNERSTTRRGAPDIDKLVERLIDDELLAQEAVALGIHEEPSIVRKVAAQRRMLALERFEYDEIESKIEITEEELRAAFAQEYATVSMHILTSKDQETADEILALMQDGADFEELARERSTDQYASRGGKMDKVERVDLPMGLATRAWSLPPGEVAGPYKTRAGWSVLRVDGTGAADPERFDAVRDWLEGQQRFREAERLRDDLGRRLREKYDVSVNEEAVKAIGCEELTDGRLAPEIEDPAAIVAQVGERSISAAELGSELNERWKGVRNLDAALATRELLLQRMIRNELMRIESEQRHYEELPEMQRILRAYEKEQIVRLYSNDVIMPKVKISEEQVKAYYEEHKQDFSQPPRLHVGQITVKDEAEAERLAELLRQGTDLAWLARQHSIDRFKDAGGERGWLEPVPGVDAFQDQLSAAKPGDVLGPVGVPGNYVVLKVGAREERDVRPFEQVAANIRSIVFARSFRNYYDEYVARLRERSEIEIHEEVLTAMRISGAPAEEESEAEGAHGHH